MQAAVNPRAKPGASASGKKPAAKAFGDKFESAKKFNNQLKAKPGPNNTGRDNNKDKGLPKRIK